MARRPGFTLVELLVALAVTAVVSAALVPLVASARASALKVVCVARLRDLTLACNLHRTEKGVYPVQPGTTKDLSAGGVSTATAGLVAPTPPPKPTDMDAAFLNVLQPYLRFPRVDPNLDAPGDLPHELQCPTVEDADDEARQRFVEITLTRPALYTGYAYCVRPKDNTLVAAVRLLKPERVASSKVMDQRGVVWADDVQWSVPETTWRFAHGVPWARPGRMPLTYADVAGLLGQHRAYSDGSVEWMNGSEIDLDIAKNRSTAAASASMSVLDLFFFWF